MHFQVRFTSSGLGSCESEVEVSSDHYKTAVAAAALRVYGYRVKFIPDELGAKVWPSGHITQCGEVCRGRSGIRVPVRVDIRIIELEQSGEVQQTVSCAAE